MEFGKTLQSTIAGYKDTKWKSAASDNMKRVKEFTQSLPIPKVTFTRWGNHSSGKFLDDYLIFSPPTLFHL